MPRCIVQYGFIMKTKNNITIEIKPSSIKEAISFAYMKIESKTIKKCIMEKKIIPKDVFKINY